MGGRGRLGWGEIEVVAVITVLRGLGFVFFIVFC